MFNSIRIQLALWFTGVMALVLIIFAVSAYWFLDTTLRRQTDRTLKELSNTVADAIESEREDRDQKALQDEENIKAIREATEDIRFRNYQIFVFDVAGNVVSLENKPRQEESLTAEQISGLTNRFSNLSKESSFYTLRAGNLDFRAYAAKRSLDGQSFNVFVTHPLDEEYELLERFRNILLISVPVALILASFGGYFLARKSLAPVVVMSDSASQISATNLNERLPVKNEKDELGNLAIVFNSMLERLENSFEQQRRFMADASHELRTPLAIVRGESEVALLKENRSPEELRESLEIVHDESRRLTKIVEDLFTLARADSKQFKTNFKEIYLDEILADCVRKIRVLAEKQNITINLVVNEMPAVGDEQLLYRLFINLLDNAIKYNRTGGGVSVVGETFANGYQLLIHDTGTGISPAERAKIFERFYRADKARTRQSETETSGAGLGLSIAGWIAEIHGGKIELLTSSNQGSTFAVTLPNPLKS